VFEQLEGKEGVYVKSVADKIEQYDFWLRFAGEHFTPCRKCQEKLHTDIFKASRLSFGETELRPISLRKTENGIWRFKLFFAENYRVNVGYEPINFVPCIACQKILTKLIEDAEQLIFGNKEYEPQLELNRKFEIDDDSWKTVEKRPSTEEERKRLKNDWFV